MENPKGQSDSTSASTMSNNQVMTELDSWEKLNIRKLQPFKITEFNLETINCLSSRGGLLRPTGISHGYSTPLYKDIPYVAAAHESKVRRIGGGSTVTQMSSLLQIPAYMLRPRKRIDVREELGIPYEETHAFVSEDFTEPISNELLDYYDEKVQSKRVVRPKRDFTDEDGVESHAPTSKRRKLCNKHPYFSQRFAAFYNEQLIEFLTGIPSSASTEQRPGSVSAKQSKSLNKEADVDDLQGSFIEGTWWTAEEKEKFFVFLGRRSRHDMAGIAEAIGTKSALECEVYHDLLFKTTQKLRLSSSRRDTQNEMESSKLNYNVTQEEVSIRDVPAAVEMSDAWIEIEDAQAQSLLDWESHLESQCPEHNTSQSSSKSVAYNSQVKVMGSRKTPKPQSIGRAVKDDEKSGESEDYFHERELPFQTLYLDDPVNSLVRSHILLQLAHDFRSFTLDDPYSKANVTKPLLEYIDGDVFEELNRVVIDHTRSIIRYVFSRLDALVSNSGTSSLRYDTKEDLLLSILQEIQYTLPRHTLVDSILPRQNVDMGQLSIRGGYYNPLETSWHTNLLLSRRGYQGSYQLLREPIHNSLQQPLEYNEVDNVSTAVDFETDGSDLEEKGFDDLKIINGRPVISKVAKKGEFRDWDEDREYLSDEMLDYSAHPIGSKMRKKIMARSIQPPRHVNEFSEDDIKDMIETIRALEDGKISHSALLERTLLSQSTGRLPRERDSDSEACLSDHEDDEWESAESEYEESASVGSEQPESLPNAWKWIQDLDDPYKDFEEPRSDLDDTVSIRTDKGASSNNMRIRVKADALLAYEEQVLNDYDSKQSKKEEENLVKFLAEEDERMSATYDQLVDWYEEDKQLIAKMFQYIEEDEKTLQQLPLDDLVDENINDSDVSLLSPDEDSVDNPILNQNQDESEVIKNAPDTRFGNQQTQSPSKPKRWNKHLQKQVKLNCPSSVNKKFLHGLDSDTLFQIRLFVTQYPLIAIPSRIQYLNGFRKMIAKNTSSSLALQRRQRLVEKLKEELSSCLNKISSSTCHKSPRTNGTEGDQIAISLLHTSGSDEPAKPHDTSDNENASEYLETLLDLQLRTFPAQGDLGIADDPDNNDSE